MKHNYLPFEKNLKEIDEIITLLRSTAADNPEDEKDLTKAIDKRAAMLKKMYSNISPWQRVQIARHPDRPYSLDYILRWDPEFIELHGDRQYRDDNAVIAGIGTLDGRKVVYIGQQKGRGTKDNLFRNFGMMHPEGYRKALRIMKLGEKFGLPVITLIDTQGAYPGLEAEERGQGEAIARNLMDMSKLKVPVISVVIGEGASGGALGIGVCDRMIMLENTWFSVISPEGCASILWHDAGKASDAAEALKLTPENLIQQGLCDRVVNEPPGGAHRDHDSAAMILKNVLLEELEALDAMDVSKALDLRIEKYKGLSSYRETS